MSRSDEEGFHPHPGDPWHPEWSREEEAGEEAEEEASAPDEDDQQAPRRRGLFRRHRAEPEPGEEPEPEGEPAGETDEGVAGPQAGWEELTGEEIEDLEEISGEFPSWTEEGLPAADFESEFTVGGDVSMEGPEADEPPAGEDEPPPPAFADEPDAPTEVPDLPAVGEGPGGPEAGDGEPGGAGAGDEDALEMITEELDAVEIDGAEEPAASPVSAAAPQDSLAGLEVPGDEPEPADPGYTPEPEEWDGAGDEEDVVPAGEVDAALEALAAEPTAAADPDAFEALRSIDEEEDLGEWEAFAGGESAGVPVRQAEPPDASGPDPEPDGLPPPLAPALEGGLEDLPSEQVPVAEDEPAPGEEEDLSPGAPTRRGLFGRRSLEAGPGGEPGAEPGAPEPVGDDGIEPPPGGPPAPEGPVAEGPVEPAPPAPDATGWEDDETIGDEETADAFFGAEEPKRRRLFGRRGRVEEEPGEVWAAEEEPGGGSPDESDPPGEEAWGEPTVEHDVAAGDPDPPGEPPADEQRLSDLPLVDGADERIEVVPLAGEDAGPPPPPPDRAGPAEPVVEAFGGGPPPPPPPDDEEGEGEAAGDPSRLPASWFDEVDEADEVGEGIPEGEAPRPAAVEEAPLLEAGEMFDVGDILDPVEEEPQPAPFAEPGPIAEPPPAPPAGGGFGEPVEPPDLFGPPPGGGRPMPTPPPEARDDAAPDLLGTASSLFPEDESGPSDESYDEPEGDDAYVGTGVPYDDGPRGEPEPYPAAGPYDEEPRGEAVYGDDAREEEAHGEDVHTGTSEVYDVVEDDLDAAPGPPPPPGPEEGVEWGDGVYSGAVTTEHRGLAEAIARAGGEEMEQQALSAAMPGLETGVVGFEDVEDLGTDEVYIPPARSDLGARIVTGVLLISLLLASLWAGGAALAAFIGLMTVLGLTEFYTTLRHKGYTPLALFGILGTIGALAGAWFWGPIAVPGAIVATAAVTFFFYAFLPRRRDVLVNGGLTVLGVAWLGGTVALAMPIIATEDYRVLVFALVAATVAMDVGAYGFGKAWGSAQMSPVLSPNKSIEGLAGGVVLSIGAAMAAGYLLDPFDIRTGAALGIVVAVAAPLGDLAESMFKRSLGVKDMGSILPGHGGIMDRIDSFLFVIPPVWVLYEFLGYLV